MPRVRKRCACEHGGRCYSHNRKEKDCVGFDVCPHKQMVEVGD